MNQLKSVFDIFFLIPLGFLMYLILLLVANFLAVQISNALYQNIILFLNANILLFSIMMLSFMISKIFWVLYFPFNLPAPIFSAISNVFVITFVLRSLFFIEVINNFKISWFVASWTWLIYGIIFLCTLIKGYRHIFLNRFSTKAPKEKESRTKAVKKKFSSKNKEQFKKELKNAGQAIKEAVQDLIQTIKKLIKEQN